MAVIKSFGTTSLGEAYLYEITNKNGLKATLTNYGAKLVTLLVPDKDGKLIDVVLGHTNAKEYEEDKNCFFGTTVGRNANRIANASFELDGVTYQLEKNDNGKNNLHSGKDCWCYKMWETKESSDNAVTFAIFSPDGEQGFPGNANVEVTYTLNDDNGLEIFYHATADKKTTFNMTNHSYFNLNGENSGTILGHMLQLNASAFTPANNESIPSGEIRPVEDTPFDFREMKEIGRDIGLEEEQLIFGAGYDHNFALDKVHTDKKVLEPAAMAYAKESGITMVTLTDLPGIQLYTGNFIEGYSGKSGNVYKKRDGFCLETQYFPDSINNPAFESPITDAGQVYETTTVYRFSVLK